jgi:hypothetical protein
MGNREVARIYGENRRQEVNRHDASFFWSFLPTHFSITLLRNGPTRIAFAMALVYIAVLSLQFRSARRKRSDALARMSERLRPEFEERHERSLAGLLPVGACPDRSYRRYERDTAWDVGYLECAAGLHYYGDVKTLHLSYSQIERVRVVGALRPRLQLTYRVTRSGPVEFLSIEVRDGSSATEQYATLQQIRAKIALLPNTPPLAAAN